MTGPERPGDPAFEDPAFDDAAFDDPAFEDLRALLADARATDPVPPEVAARLDATLAALQEERRAENVVPLRRRTGRFLVAAAAVVVIASGGIAVAQLDRDGSGGSDDTATSAGSADQSETLGTTPTAPEAAPPGRSGGATKSDQGLAQLDGIAVPVFTTARFAEEAAGFDAAARGFAAGDEKAAASPSPGTTSTTEPNATSATPDRALAEACPGPTIADTESVPILLDGDPAVLVLHPVADGTQVLEAWSCDGSAVLATATVTR